MEKYKTLLFSRLKINFKNVSNFGMSMIFERASPLILSLFAGIILDIESLNKFGTFVISLNTIASFSTFGISVYIIKLSNQSKNGDENSQKYIQLLFLATLILSIIIGTLNIFLYRTNSVDSLLIQFFLVFSAISATGISNINSVLLGLQNFSALYKSSFIFFSVVVVLGIFSLIVNTLNSFLLTVTISYFIYFLVLLKTRVIKIEATIFQVKFHEIKKIFGSIQLFIYPALMFSGQLWIVNNQLKSNGSLSDHGCFLISLQWIALCNFIPNLIIRYYFPKMLENAASESLKQICLNLVRAISIVVVITSLLSFTSYFLSNHIEKLYPNLPGFGILFPKMLLLSIPGSLVSLFGNQLIALEGLRKWLFSSATGSALVYFGVFFDLVHEAILGMALMALAYSATILFSFLFIVQTKKVSYAKNKI